MKQWSGAQRAFAVKSYYKNNDSGRRTVRTPENIAALRTAVNRVLLRDEPVFLKLLTNILMACAEGMRS
jgi:hypothetical protein